MSKVSCIQRLTCKSPTLTCFPNHPPTHSLTQSINHLLEQGRPDEAAALLEEARARYYSSSAEPINGLDTGDNRNATVKGTSYPPSSSRETGNGSFPFVDETTAAASYFGRSSPRASWRACDDRSSWRESRDNEPVSTRVSCSSSVADEAGPVLLGRSSSPWRSCEEWPSCDEAEPDGTEPPTPYGTEPPTPYGTEPPTPSTERCGHSPDRRFDV